MNVSSVLETSQMFNVCTPTHTTHRIDNPFLSKCLLYYRNSHFYCLLTWHAKYWQCHFLCQLGEKPLYTPTLQLVFREHVLNCSCFTASGNCILTYESSCIFMQHNIIQKNEFTLLILSFCTYWCCAFLSLYSCSFVKCWNLY